MPSPERGNRTAGDLPSPAPETVAGGAVARVDVLGVGVDPLTLDQAVQRVVALVEAGRGGLVVTPNPEVIVVAWDDLRLRAILNAAEVAVADGVGVVWAAGRLGTPVPERVAGYDLFRRLLAVAARHGYRVFFLGGRPGVADAAARRARDAFPGLEVAGTHHGYFRPAEEPDVVEAIRAAHPDLVFVGMGVGRQEHWMGRNRSRLGKSVLMAVGGSLDVLAGVVRRAPAAWQRLRLEWLYRLLRDPARWRRQAATLPRFVWAVLAGRPALEGDR